MMATMTMIAMMRKGDIKRRGREECANHLGRAEDCPPYPSRVKFTVQDPAVRKRRGVIFLLAATAAYRH